MESASFAGTPDSGRSARRFVVDALLRAGADDLADDAATCIAELAANAVLHARGRFRVDVYIRDEGVRIAVADKNVARLPVLIPADGTAEEITLESATGRGLRIVSALASRWGVDAAGDSKTVWCELDRSAATGQTDPVVNDARHVAEAAMTVTLLGLPVRPAIGSGMQVDELVREVQLGLFDVAVTEEQRTRFWELLDASAPARLAGRVAALDAAKRGEEHFDVAVPVDADSAAAVVALRELLELFPSRVAFTTAAPSPEVVEFRAWVEREVAAQLQGATPRAYSEAQPPT